MAYQNILAHFTSGGSPATGLSPTIRVRDVDLGTLAVTDAAMTEVGDGAYTYDFTGYDSQKDYSIRCDGGTTLSGSERYTFGGNDSYVDDVWDRDLSLHSTDGSAGKIVSDLETYTMRALGLMQENYYLDNNTYDIYNGIKLLTGARIRIYSNASSVGTASDIVATYQIVSVWNDDELQTYKVIKQ